MRSISDALESAQKVVGDALCKIVLTLQSDSTEYTYDINSETNRILSLSHPEQEWSQTAQIIVDNRDGNLTDLTLEGCSAVISYGYHTTSDEYSATAPLEAIASQTDSLQGELVTSISLAGVFNMMGEDEASEAYTPEDTNTDTVKTILTAIANKTMTGFTHCKSYTIVFDDENRGFFTDSLINTFKPADYFSVSFKESRLSAFKKALSYTGDKARIRHDGYIHVFRPTPYAPDWEADTEYGLTDKVKPTTPNGFEYICTTAGTSDSAGNEPTWPTTEDSTVAEDGVDTLVWTIVWYDYEYNDASGDYHNFFDKSVRKRLVIPNRVYVLNHPDHSDEYTGNAIDSSSYTALARYINEYHYARPTSSAQCGLIAAAILRNYQLGAERGHGRAPMNVGQEVMDYVKITDSKASDTKTGNIGYLERRYRPGEFVFDFGFGGLVSVGLAGTQFPRTTSTTVYGDVTYADLMNIVDYFNNRLRERDETINTIIDGYNTMWDYLIAREEVIPKLHVTKQLIIPVIVP